MSSKTPPLVGTQYYLLTLVTFFHLPWTSLNILVLIIAEFIKEQKFSNSNAEQAVKHWFKGAIDRRGGRKLRAEKNGL